jgi:DNA mismatch endonuclease (patch repair protein)
VIVDMPDTFSSEERSRIMRAVKGKDSTLEVTVRSALWRSGLRFRKNVASLPGKPDIVFSKSKVVVFIDSCFWHGCPNHLRRPGSHQDYWEAKISRNRQRDTEVTETYRQMGWTALRIWEHELKENLESCLARIVDAVRQQ